ncbi:MAG: hypothetical protein RI907_1010 [Pseudomonadota bacterium]|jgi:pimeloyl-ACP methyl ester carboxylesterase
MLPAILSAALLLWGAAVTTVAVKQEALLFHGTPLPAQVQPPTSIEDRYIDVPGARLHGWLYHRPGGSKGLVMYLHGNSGNVATWLDQTRFWEEAGFDVFIVDYRGFGRSTGEIQNEAQLHDDVWAAWQSVSPAYQGKRVVLLGRSLGTGLATRLSTRIDADLLVLVSPYASMQRMAHERYAWVPGFALKYPLHSDIDLPHTRARQTLMFHGEADTLIPIDHAVTLQALYPTAQLVRVPGAGHNNIQASTLYRQTLMDALKAVPAP